MYVTYCVFTICHEAVGTNYKTFIFVLFYFVSSSVAVSLKL